MRIILFTLGRLWHEVHGPGLGPESLSGAVDPHVHALRLNGAQVLSLHAHVIEIYSHLVGLRQPEVPVDDRLVRVAVVVSHVGGVFLALVGPSFEQRVGRSPWGRRDGRRADERGASQHNDAREPVWRGGGAASNLRQQMLHKTLRLTNVYFIKLLII